MSACADIRRPETGANLVHGVLREEGLGFLGADGRVNDDIVALPPVDGGGDTVLVTNLEGCIECEYASGFSGVTWGYTYSR